MKKLIGLVFVSACVIPAAQPSGGGGGYPPPSTSSAGGGGDPAGETSAPPAPQGPVSVDIHNTCPNNVKVFYGDRPKWGSGTYSSIESNSIESHSFNAGEMMWIVDDEENGLSSTSVGPGMHEIDILPSCTGFQVR